MSCSLIDRDTGNSIVDSVCCSFCLFLQEKEDVDVRCELDGTLDDDNDDD